MLHTSRSRIAALVGGLLALLAAPLALAGIGRHHGWHGDVDPDQAVSFVKARATELLDELDATPEQREAIEAIVDGAVPEAFDLKARGEVVRVALREAFDDGSDRATIEALRAQATELFDEATRSASDRILDVREVLTPAQWSELQAMRDARFSGGPFGRGHHAPWH